MSAILFSYLLPAVHVTACLFLIVVVLLQTGKGADMGAVLGGGSQTLFGASGAGNLLTKLTTGMAITFMATSLVIAIGQREQPSSGLIDRLPDAEAIAPIPVPPPAEPAAQADGVAPAAPAEAAPQANAKPAESTPVPSAPATPAAAAADAPVAAPVPEVKPAEAPVAAP